MKKQMFRVTLTENANNSCSDLVLLSAKSNGGKRLTLLQLKNLYDSDKIRYPTITKDSTAELLSDNLLHIDQKVGETYETVCIIEQVEIMELANLENVVSQQNGYGALAD